MLTRALPALVLVAVVGCGSEELAGHADAHVDLSTEVHDMVTEPPCIPGTPGGECNVIEQCGCDTDEYCAVVYACDLPPGSFCGIKEWCQASRPGTADVGERCRSWDDCRPGTTCRITNPLSSRQCYQWCITDDECDGLESACTVSTSTMWWGIESTPDGFPYYLCTLP
jgi:hypothetical protein